MNGPEILKKKVTTMKLKMTTAVLVSLFIAFIGTLNAKEEKIVEISAYDTLYVRIIDHSGIYTAEANLTDIGEKDRFNHLSQSISSVIENEEYPVNLKFIRFGSDIPEGVTVLNINLLEWRINRLGEFETRMSATLNSPSGKEKLGIFVGRYLTIDFNPPATTIEHFKTSARRATEKLVPELQYRTIIKG